MATVWIAASGAVIVATAPRDREFMSMTWKRMVALDDDVREAVADRGQAHPASLPFNSAMLWCRVLVAVTGTQP